jgi:hypothetical protein
MLSIPDRTCRRPSLPPVPLFKKQKKNEKKNNMKKIKSIAAAFTLAAAASVAAVPAAEAQTYYYPPQTYSQQQQAANQNAEIGMGILGLLGGVLLMHELGKNHHDSHHRHYVAPRPVHKSYMPRRNSHHHR